MYLFHTPKELIAKLSTVIEKERLSQSLKQQDLAEKADIPLPTYKAFIHHQKISLENVFKLLFALKLQNNIEGLLSEKSYETLASFKEKSNLPKRVR